MKVEKKMYRYDRIDSPTMPTPGLSSTAESPQSSSLPSASTSIVEELAPSVVPTEKKDTVVSTGGIEIEAQPT